MTRDVARDAIDRFRGAIAGRLGLQLDESGRQTASEALRNRLEATGETADVYLDKLESGRERIGELGALARELTVGETYFFRNFEQFAAVRDVVLAPRAAASQGVRMLSAGCSSGEEPYSLAILAREQGFPDERVSIVGADINPAMLRKGREGVYSAWALRETDARLRRAWFRERGKAFALDASIVRAVELRECNLIDPASDLWAPNTFDVVFCRNVLMYLTPSEARALVDRITGALKAEGHLFLGHAETLRGVTQDYHLRHTHGTFYYQKRSSGSTHRSAPTRFGSTPSSSTASRVAEPHWVSSWVETVQRTSERIASLASVAVPHSEADEARFVDSGRRPDLSAAMELLADERFSDAIEHLGRLPPDLSSDPEVALLRAVLLTHSGELDAARALCERLLELDDFHAGAHYLLALCAEGTRDIAAALEHDRIATYLEPAFAMPRLHLGLLARRSGDETAARRELGTALVLLEREDQARLLLFGGGFGREALVQLCRSQLAACGGGQ